MARLNHEQIVLELNKTPFELIDDSNYVSKNSLIKVACRAKGHEFEASLNDMSKTSFMCPMCDTKINFVNPSSVPQKNGKFRIIGIDQATENFGLSIFDDGELVFYNLYIFSGDLMSRIVKIRKLFNDLIIPYWQPDIVVMEDVIYQNSILTFKVLSMLLGVVQECCRENDVNYSVVAPGVWRKYSGTNGANRKEEKMLSVAKVKEKYNITVNDDTAEAILIGQYGVKTHRPKPITFGKTK